jgi:hypothetical protein
LGGNPDESGWPEIRGILRGAGLADEESEEAPARRGIADRRPLFRGHPRGDELADGAVGLQDSERTVRGIRQLHGELDDALEHDLQLEFGSKLETRTDELVPAIHLERQPSASRRPGERPVPPGTIVPAVGFGDLPDSAWRFYR